MSRRRRASNRPCACTHHARHASSAPMALHCSSQHSVCQLAHAGCTQLCSCVHPRLRAHVWMSAAALLPSQTLSAQAKDRCTYQVPEHMSSCCTLLPTICSSRWAPTDLCSCCCRCCSGVLFLHMHLLAVMVLVPLFSLHKPCNKRDGLLAQQQPGKAALRKPLCARYFAAMHAGWTQLTSSPAHLVLHPMVLVMAAWLAPGLVLRRGRWGRRRWHGPPTAFPSERTKTWTW